MDKRTDIWAFGCVLYEMLTGRAAFPGDTVTDLPKAIHREPDWSHFRRPHRTRFAACSVECLVKDSQHRLHDIGDVCPHDRRHSVGFEEWSNDGASPSVRRR